MTGVSAPPAGAPKDYRIVLPEGWSRIDVRPERRDRAIRSLLNRQFRGVDNVPWLRRQLQERLSALAERARAGGGIEIYICHQEILGAPLPASLVVSLTPPAKDGGGVTPEQLAGTLGDGRDVCIVDLPAGKAVRTRVRTVPAAGDPSGNTLPVTNLVHYVPVPASGSYLVLAFSTNLDPLADSLVELFDAIARTLQWIG